jgi:hypothetical protein
MKRTDINELYNIAPISNVPSILGQGILCHNLVKKIQHDRIDNLDVQSRRVNKQVGNTGKTLHDFANLYFDAHNPMLCSRKEENDKLCVLIISQDVLDLDGVIVSDQNASRGWARFESVDDGLALLDANEVFAAYWTDPDPYERDRLKGVKCAEVLVPERVDPRFIIGAYVCSLRALAEFRKKSTLPVSLKTEIFF